MREVESPAARADRHAAYLARERRTNIVHMAKRMFVLQIGHHGGTWMVDESAQEDQNAVCCKMARQSLAAATAFVTESELLLIEKDGNT